jgi:epoxyqueuosine reductase QueG
VLKAAIGCGNNRRFSMLANELKQFAHAAGADLVGIAPVDRLKDVPGYTPTDLLPSARSVVVMGKRALKGFIMPGRGRAVSWGMIHLNLKLNEICYEVAKYIEDRGRVALPVFFIYTTYLKPKEPSFNAILDTKWFAYAPAAAQAGLGEVGFNHLLLTPEYGPKVRLTAVITDAELTPDQLLGSNLCPGVSCNLCAEACPVGAISAEGIDKARCHNYLDLNQEVLGYGACAMCIKACPVGG